MAKVADVANMDFPADSQKETCPGQIVPIERLEEIPALLFIFRKIRL